MLPLWSVYLNVLQRAFFSIHAKTLFLTRGARFQSLGGDFILDSNDGKEEFWLLENVAFVIVSKWMNLYLHCKEKTPTLPSCLQVCDALTTKIDFYLAFSMQPSCFCLYTLTLAIVQIYRFPQRHSTAQTLLSFAVLNVRSISRLQSRGNCGTLKRFAVLATLAFVRFLTWHRLLWTNAALLRLNLPLWQTSACCSTGSTGFYGF